MPQVPHICENLDDFYALAGMIFCRHKDERGIQTCDEKEVHVYARLSIRCPSLRTNVFSFEFGRLAIHSREESGQIDGQPTECGSDISTREQTCARVNEHSPSTSDGTSDQSDSIGKQASDGIAWPLHAPSSDDHHA